MISILMATYNGEKYIAQQIESLLSQTISDFTLHIRDDFSTDSTWDILQKYAKIYPEKIILSKRAQNSGSAKFNFLELMSQIRDDYIMTCDQDDVWNTDKIEKTLCKMKEMEKTYGKDVPVLVHTDLCVVDKDLKIIQPSFKAAMNANYERTAINQIVIQNTLTGCTAMYNSALAKLLLKTPEYCIMHDWWLILVASAFGQIANIKDRTIMYRQHDKNEVGSSDVRTLSYKIHKLTHGAEVKIAIQNTYKQAASFLSVYKDQLTAKQITLLEDYSKIPTYSKWRRWKTVCRLKTFKNGFFRNVAFLIFI